MKESMIQEALLLYSQMGNNAVDEINKVMNVFESRVDTDEIKKKKKLLAIYDDEVSSPEDILVNREKSKYITHFFIWLEHYIKGVDELNWNIWRDFYLHGLKMSEVCKKYNISRRSANSRKARTNAFIQSILPLYYEQFIDLREYIKND